MSLPADWGSVRTRIKEGGIKFETQGLGKVDECSKEAAEFEVGAM